MWLFTVLIIQELYKGPSFASQFIYSSLKRPGAALRFLSWQRATFLPNSRITLQALRDHGQAVQAVSSQTPKETHQKLPGMLLADTTQANWTNGALTCRRGYFFNGGWQSNLGWSPQTLTSFSLALHCYTYHSFILSISFHSGCCVYLFNSPNLLSLPKSLQF